MRPIFTLLIILAATLTPLYSQRLYNQAQDQKAEAALALARELAASSVFDKAIANLAELQKLRNEDVFRSGRLLMGAEMGSWRTWDDLETSILRFEGALVHSEGGGTLSTELTAAKARQANAEAELAMLTLKLTADSTADTVNLVGDWMGRIAKVKPLADYLIALEKDPAAKAKAAGQAKTALDRLAKIYQDFQLDLPERPSKLFLESKLESLALEVQHVENLIGIQQRLDRELKDIRAVLNSTKNGVAKFKPLFAGKSIQESLADQAQKAKTDTTEKENLGEMLFLLYNASALAARNHTPVRLAELRESLEDRAHSLRQAGASSAAYEAIITNGIQRLSLYYKGGIKPQTIADLIQAFATVGLIPAISLN